MADGNVTTAASITRDFSKVLITLENVLIPEEKLSETPSMQDGLDKDVETDLRVLGCELIQTAGILLKLPQVAMATGQVIFQRFYYSKSFIKHNMEVVAMASIMLASKIEECPRRNRDVVNVFHHVKQVRNKRNIHPLALDQNYINLKNQVIKAERRVLKELGFCVHVKHPHKIIFMYLEVLDSTKKRHLVQSAWNFMNDSLRSDVFMRFHPEAIACACIYLAARQCSIVLPNNPPWYWLFTVDEEDIQQICLSILRLYSRPKPNYESLEKTVEELKKKQAAAKSKAKGIVSDVDTPNSNSRQNSPKGISPNPSSLMASIKKEKEKADRGESDVKRSDSDHGNGIQAYDRHAKKRIRDHSVDSISPPSGLSDSDSDSHRRSSSRSESPNNKKRRRSPGGKKPKKLEAFGREKHKKKYRSRSRSLSLSRSPVQRLSKNSKKYRKEEYKEGRDYYKDKDSYREKDPYTREKDIREKDYYKERDYYKDRDYRERRSFSPEKERHRSRKNRNNGHRDSPIREKNDKHRR